MASKYPQWTTLQKIAEEFELSLEELRVYGTTYFYDEKNMSTQCCKDKSVITL